MEVNKNYIINRINKIQVEIDHLDLPNEAYALVSRIFNYNYFDKLIFLVTIDVINKLKYYNTHYGYGVIWYKNDNLKKLVNLVKEIYILTSLNAEPSEIINNPIFSLCDENIDFFINHKDLFDIYKNHITKITNKSFENWWAESADILLLSLHWLSKIDNLIDYNSNILIDIITDCLKNYTPLDYTEENENHLTNKKIYKKCFTNMDVIDYCTHIPEIDIFKAFYGFLTKKQELYFIEHLGDTAWQWISEDMFRYHKDKVKSKIFISKVIE